MNDHRKPPPAGESLADLLGGAVTDIRQKLVEEAWFGRALSGQDQPTYYDMTRSIYGEPKSLDSERTAEIQSPNQIDR